MLFMSEIHFIGSGQLDPNMSLSSLHTATGALWRRKAAAPVLEPNTADQSDQIELPIQ